MRYAIYYSPRPDDDLNAAAAAWLGRDAHTGKSCRQPELDWLDPRDLKNLTADPRRYGFHGTLKAPFHLAAAACPDDLISQVERFAARTAPLVLDDGLKVARLGSFFALAPVAEEPALTEFASACVREFEPFRAPLSEQDMQRRRNSNMTANQDAHLVQWGYPYIFDEFRFHLTLTGRVPESLWDSLFIEFEARFARFCRKPFKLDSVSLFVQTRPDEAFRVAALFPLSGEAALQR